MTVRILDGMGLTLPQLCQNYLYLSVLIVKLSASATAPERHSLDDR